MDEKMINFFLGEIKKNYTIYLIICSKDSESYVDKLYFTKHHIKYYINDIYDFLYSSFYLTIDEVDVLIVKWVGQIIPTIEFDLNKYKPVTIV